MTHILKSTLTRGGGYLLNDNRASGGKLDEADILCCYHCQRIIRADEPDEKHLCRRGGHVICASCKGKEMTEGCSPFKAYADQERERWERRRQLERAIGLNPPGVVLPEE